MSRKVNQKIASYFILNEKKVFPHVTVYQGYFPKENIEKVKQSVIRILAKTQPFTIEMGGFSISHETFLFWRCFKSESLLRLQEEVIKETNHLRDGLILPMLSNVDEFSSEDKFDTQNYGALLIGPGYNAHMSITRIKNAQDGETALEMLGKQKVKHSFKVNSLVIGYLGDHGTVNEIIDKIPLI